MEGRPSKGAGNSVAIFEIHIVPGYCIGQCSVSYLLILDFHFIKCTLLTLHSKGCCVFKCELSTFVYL